MLSVGVFIDSMQHLLVVCTQTTLIVLGLAKPDIPSPALTAPIDGSLPQFVSQDFVVYDTELRFPTDNVTMTSIVSTNAGRAFMCGVSDGHLYELQYQATEGWFGGKSSLYNHSVSGITSFLPSVFSSTSSG
jgi:nuclear pore complex protein Nup155